MVSYSRSLRVRHDYDRCQSTTKPANKERMPNPLQPWFAVFADHLHCSHHRVGSPSRARRCLVCVVLFLPGIAVTFLNIRPSQFDRTRRHRFETSLCLFCDDVYVGVYSVWHRWRRRHIRSLYGTDLFLAAPVVRNRICHQPLG